MNRPHPRALGILLLAALSLATAAAVEPLPRIDRPVTDLAGVMTPSGVRQAEEVTEAHRSKTGVQIAVLAVRTTGAIPIEEFSRRVAESWAGGSRGRDDGVLFTLAVADRTMRIEVGYGLEPYLTDADCLRIQERIRERLRASDFDGAVLGAVRGIAEKTSAIEAGTPIPPPAPPSVPLGARLPWTYLAVFALGALGAAVTSVLESRGNKGTFYWTWNGAAFLAAPLLLAVVFMRGGFWWAYPLVYLAAALAGFLVAILWEDSRASVAIVGIWLFAVMPASIARMWLTPGPGLRATGGEVLWTAVIHIFGCGGLSVLIPFPYLLFLWVKRRREGRLAGWGAILLSPPSHGGSTGRGGIAWGGSSLRSGASRTAFSGGSSPSSSGASWSGGGGRFGGGGASSSW